jgi:hypothetical protein
MVISVGDGTTVPLRADLDGWDRRLAPTSVSRRWSNSGYGSDVYVGLIPLLDIR